MELFHWIAGGVLALLWSSRVVETAFGLPRIRDISGYEWAGTEIPLPRLSVIVPARNEARDIEACVTSLLELDYPDFEVIAVNDRSTDATGAIMDRLAAAHAGSSRLKVIHITDLPPGWMGKTHAMWSASERASGELLLFTDGDTFFRVDALRRAVAFMESIHADHLVLFPTMLFKTAGEKMMLSFFHAALSFAHRPWKVSDPNARDHIGVGAFNLVRREAYEAIGTYRAMQMEVIDDLQLGKRLKERGFRQDVALGRDLVSIHWATGAFGVAHALSKNSFALLRFNWALVIGGCVGIALVTLGPLVGLLLAPGWTKLGYGVALAAMARLYFQTGRVTAIAGGYFFLHPIAGCMSIYALLRSAGLTSWRGVTWRGTNYPLKQFANKDKLES